MLITRSTLTVVALVAVLCALAAAALGLYFGDHQVTGVDSLGTWGCGSALDQVPACASGAYEPWSGRMHAAFSTAAIAGGLAVVTGFLRVLAVNSMRISPTDR